MRVLVVDDRAQERYLASMVLHSGGHEVASAANGVEALAILRQGGIDLVVSDIMMPVMDGFRLCQECRRDEQLKDIAFIFLTATYTDDADERLAMQIGADLFLRKPIEPAALLEAVQGLQETIASGRLPHDRSDRPREEDTLKLYSERLVAKLEQKVLALEAETAERVKATQALRESEGKYRSLFLHSLDPIYIVAVDGTTIDANPAWLDLFGYSRDELPRVRAMDMYADPSEREDFLRRIELSGFVKDEVRLKKQDGTVIECQRWVVARTDESGKVIAFQGIIRDVTEENRRNDALADEVLRRRMLLEQSRDGIVVLDQDGKVAEANLSFARMLGYSAEEMRQLHVWDWEVLATREQLREMIRTVGEAGDHFDTRHRRKDGTLYDVEVSTNGAVFAGRKLIFCVCRDITERKRAEQAIRQSEERLRELAAHLEEVREEERTGIARELHDQVGQSLTALKMDLRGVAHSAREGTPIDPEKLDAVVKLVDAATDDVRRISSELRPGILDDLGLAAAIEWQLEQFEQRTGIECVLTASSCPEPERSTSTALYRVFQELLTNVARHAEARSVRVDFAQQDNSYVLTVTDDGRGITQHEIDNTTSLGLIGIRERLRPLGGEITFSGTLGEGTIVCVAVPVA